MHEDKDTSQGQSIKVIIKKKPISIPKFHDKPSRRNPIETDVIRNLIRINHAPKLNIIDVKLKEIPKLRILDVSTCKFSQTPTPRQKFGASYFNKSFDTPKTSKHTSNTFSIDYREHGSNSNSNRNKKFNSELCSKIGGRIRVFREKMTMKDLNLNLPVIIKSKKTRKKISYKYNFGEILY